MHLALLLPCSLLVLHAFGLHHHGQPGRRVCGRSFQNSDPVVLHTESFVQPIHKPYITHCQGHRLCSTYRTLYRVAYRSVSRLAPAEHSYPECCPGWRRLHSHNCNQAVCTEACSNGGTCIRPNQCACASGWMGRSCQADIDECSSSKPCSQTCLNTAGSFRCGCRAGYTLAEDGHSCQMLPDATSLADDIQPPSSSNSTGGSTPKGPDADTVNNVTGEVQLLKNRVQLLEEKLQQALAPFTSLFPLSLEQSVAERTSFLTHSFQQLERIDSLSEQIGFLEERLETCSCQDN